MRWFQGDIPSAIRTAKENKSVFIVFIAGECDKTKEMEKLVHSEEVTRLCEESNCVAVKLSGASNDCKFFSQIYPVVVIPSIFFIGDNGVPLEVIGECTSLQDLRDKVKKTLELQRGMSAPASEPVCEGATSMPAQALQSSSEPQAKSASDSPSVEPTMPGAGAVGEDNGGDTPETEGAGQNLDERVDRAKELIEFKRQEKMRKEAEEARRKEIERRNLGQGVQKLRDQQKEMQLLEAKRELQKDKENDRLARQKVKEEIERDRAEKALKFNRKKNDEALAKEEERKKKLSEQQAALAEEQAKRSDIARIQFRMADGSFLTHQFPATDTFAALEDFITQHLGSEVSLSTTFPRRVFVADDRSRTLQELQLAPSAAILVLPRGQSGNEVRNSQDLTLFGSITSLVLSPFVFVWNLLCSLLGMSGSSSQGSAPSTGGAAAAGVSRSSTQRGAAPTGSRQEGGAIRRFRNAQDDEKDDDRNTWNGNSTQQM